MADKTSGSSFASAAKPFARRVNRARNLIAQGMSEMTSPPATTHELSDYYIEFGDGAPIIRRPDRPGHITISDDTIEQLAEKAGGQPVDFVFVGNSCIDLRFKLPDGLLSELRPIIENEIQYRSPFSDDAAFSMWVAEELPDHSWQARAAVTLRKPVENLLAQLEAQGIRPGVARRDGKDTHFAAKPAWLGYAPTKHGKLGRWPMAIKLALLGAVIFTGSATALTVRNSVAAADLAAQAAEARAVLSAQARAAAETRALDDALGRATDKLAMTGRLSELLPEGVWLDQLVIEDETVTLIGFAPSAADITRLLATLPELSDIRFASPVTRDNTQSLERFRIAATLDEAAE